MAPHPSPLIPYRRDFFAMDKDPRVGLQKGIQYYLNSCYLDSAFMLLFYHHSHFDELFNAAARHEFSPGIREIVESVRRNSRYCPYTITMELRGLLKDVFGSSICGDFMDIDVFLQKFFAAMKFSPFIEYRGGTKNYSHSIFLNAPGQRLSPENCSVQSLLDSSLEFQSLAFRLPPSPGLLIKLPYSNGVLMGMDYVVPSLELRIRVTNEAGQQEFPYTLIGVACLNANHYTAFLRDFDQYSPEWLHYNSKSGIQISEVVECRDLEQQLQEVQQDPGKIPQFLRTSPVFKYLCSTTIYCVYVPKETTRVKEMLEIVRALEPTAVEPLGTMADSSPTITTFENRDLGASAGVVRSNHQALTKSKESYDFTSFASFANAPGGITCWNLPGHHQPGLNSAVVVPTQTHRTKTPAEEWLQSEWDNMKRAPPRMGCAAPTSPSNLFKWTAIIQGPQRSPYEGGTFKVSLTFSRTLPREPPTCKFITPIHHLNFNNEKSFNLLELLRPGAEASLTVAQVITEIYNLMERPNADKSLSRGMTYSHTGFGGQEYSQSARTATRQHGCPTCPIQGHCKFF